MSARPDVVVVTDPRLVGGGNKSLAEEIAAHSAAGYTTGLFPMAGPASGARPLDSSLRALLAAGHLTMLRPDEPIETSLVIARGPSMFGVPQSTRPAITADHWLIVANAYNTDPAVSAMLYDAEEMGERAAEHFGHRWTWVPLSQIVRDALNAHHPSLELAPFDWSNIIDLDAWRLDRPDTLPRPIRIGRHSRDSAAKWPTAAREIRDSLPDDPVFRVEVMGGARTPTALLGELPANWTVHPFGALAPREFLRRIDLFSYFHHPQWEEAFGRSILEALATGAIALLPPYFASTFADAARYCHPAQVREIALELAEDPAAVHDQRARADALLRQRFSHASHVARLRGLIGPPRGAGARVGGANDQAAQRVPDLATTRADRRVLFFTDNGHGLGHVTRLMAYAKRLPGDVQGFFLTLSEAYHLVAEQGFAVEYFPGPRTMGFAPREKPYWEQIALVRLRRTIERLRPHAVVIDHVNPPTIVRDLRAVFPEVAFVWSRRGLWRQHRKPAGLRMHDAFDHIIEPMDLAAAIDLGHTTAQRSHVFQVAPVSLVGRDELLPRAEARAALGLPTRGLAVLLSLSADTTDQLGSLIATVRGILRDAAGEPITVFAPRHALHASALQDVEGVVMKPVYPVARYANAFDAAVATSGYNSYHELVYLGVPSIFIARDTGTLDDQARRASHAPLGGYGLTAESVDSPDFAAAARRLMDPRMRRRMRLAAQAVFPVNGADAAAAHIADLARHAIGVSR